MDILIINAYSANNRGDAGIVVAMIQLLRRHCPAARVRVMSSFCEENSKFYRQYDVESVPSIWCLNKFDSIFMRYLKGLWFLLIALTNPRSRVFDSFHTADLVLSAGGGYIYSSVRGPLGVGLLNVLFHYWLGKRLNKVVIGFPQSVGPVRHKLDILLVGYVLRCLDLFCVREKISNELLIEMGLRNLLLVPDIAFTLSSNKIVKNNINKSELEELAIGITVLDWRFSRKNIGTEEIDCYLEKLANTLLDICGKFSRSKIYIFPQVDVGLGDSDLNISNVLLGRLKEANAVVFDLKDYTPEAIVSLYGEMHVFIASRMHSAIFAMAAGVPTVGLAYQPKTTGTFHLLGLGANVLDIESFKERQLIDLVFNLICRQKIEESEIEIEHLFSDLNIELQGYLK